MFSESDINQKLTITGSKFMLKNENENSNGFDANEVFHAIQKNLKNYIEQIDFFEVHNYLETILNTLEKLHLATHKNSKITFHLNSIRQLLPKLRNLDSESGNFEGKYLIWLTTIAKKLQECKIYHNDNLVLLGDFLLNEIERKREFTTYLNCEITEENTISYSFTNGFHLFKNGGPFAVASAAPIDGIIAPFYQDEFKLFNLIPLGYKKQLEKENEQFTQEELSFNYAIDRKLHRYRLPRLADLHKDHHVNIFEATYTNSKSSSTENPVYIVGFHGNAYVGQAMLKYLDSQALNYLTKHPQTSQIVVIAPDYPGSAASGGKFSSLNELAYDSVVLMVKHLVKRGVSPSKIITLGHSLGGAVLTSGLHQLQAQGIITTAISLNSFSRIQKFVNDNSIIGKIIIPHYNDDSSLYFQELPLERRHVEHTSDDSVIPLSHSLLQSLKSNEKALNEGILLKNGGHDLDVHDLEPYIAIVWQNHLAYAAKDNEREFTLLCQSLNTIILEQKVVKTSFIFVSALESEDDITPLGKIKNEYQALTSKLAESNLTTTTIILFGFISHLISDIEKEEKSTQQKGFSLFSSKNPQLEALIELKGKLTASLLSKETFGQHFLTAEFLSNSEAQFLMYQNQNDSSLKI